MNQPRRLGLNACQFAGDTGVTNDKGEIEIVRGKWTAQKGHLHCEIEELFWTEIFRS